MLEMLEFIFSNFWIWVGIVIMLAVVAGGIGNIGGTIIARVIKNKDSKEDDV